MIIVIIHFILIVLDGHLVLLLVLHEQLLKLFLVNLNHVIFIVSLSIAHHLLFFTLIIIFVIHEFTVFLELVLALLLHHFLLIVVVLTFVIFDLLLHALNSIILDINFFIILIAFLSHAVFVDLVHMLLLLLDSVCNRSLLLRVKLVEVLKILLIKELLLGGIGIAFIHFLTFLAIFIFFLHFHDLALDSFVVFVFAIHLIFFVDVLLDLIRSSFHMVNAFLPDHTTHVHSTLLIGTAFLHESLATVLSWEVCCCNIESIIVLS